MFSKTYEIILNSTSLSDLKQKIDSMGLDIDEVKKGDPNLTVAGQFALNNEIEKAEWLKKLGANIGGIAYGYARAGNDGQVEACLESDPGILYFVTLAYAQVGHHRTLRQYLEHFDSPEAGLNGAAEGYARVRNHEKVEEYRQMGASVHSIARGYALAGNHRQVEVYRKKHKANADVIAVAYAQAGYHHQVEIYRKKHRVNVDVIIRGYSTVRDQERLKKYDMNLLLRSYLAKRAAVTDSFGAPKEYFHGKFFSQKSFKEKVEAVAVLQAALSGTTGVDLIAHLPALRNGKLGRAIREYVKSGLANSLVGKEVKTVRDFIQTLQNKVDSKYPHRPK